MLRIPISRLRKNSVNSASSGPVAQGFRNPQGSRRLVWRGTGSCWLAREIAHPDEVVDGQPEGKHPADARYAAMAGFAQQADLFEPAEDLFNALAFPLAHQIADVARRAAIDRTGSVRGVLRHMGRHREPAKAVHKVAGVIALVGAQRRPWRQLRRHGQGLLALREARGRRETAIDGQAMPVLHEYVSLGGDGRRGVLMLSSSYLPSTCHRPAEREESARWCA